MFKKDFNVLIYVRLYVCNVLMFEKIIYFEISVLINRMFNVVIGGWLELMEWILCSLILKIIEGKEYEEYFVDYLVSILLLRLCLNLCVIFIKKVCLGCSFLIIFKFCMEILRYMVNMSVFKVRVFIVLV